MIDCFSSVLLLFFTFSFFFYYYLLILLVRPCSVRPFMLISTILYFLAFKFVSNDHSTDRSIIRPIQIQLFRFFLMCRMVCPELVKDFDFSKQDVRACLGLGRCIYCFEIYNPWEKNMESLILGDVHSCCFTLLEVKKKIKKKISDVTPKYFI